MKGEQSIYFSKLMIMVIVIGVGTVTAVFLGFLSAHDINEVLVLLKGDSQGATVPYADQEYNALWCGQESCYGIHAFGDYIKLSKVPAQFDNPAIAQGEVWMDGLPQNGEKMIEGQLSIFDSMYGRSNIHCIPQDDVCYVIFEQCGVLCDPFVMCGDQFMVVSFRMSTGEEIARLDLRKDANDGSDDDWLEAVCHISPKNGFHCDTDNCYVLAEVDDWQPWESHNIIIKFNRNLNQEPTRTGNQYKCEALLGTYEDPSFTAFGCERDPHGKCYIGCSYGVFLIGKELATDGKLGIIDKDDINYNNDPDVGSDDGADIQILDDGEHDLKYNIHCDGSHCYSQPGKWFEQTQPEKMESVFNWDKFRNPSGLVNIFDYYLIGSMSCLSRYEEVSTTQTGPIIGGTRCFFMSFKTGWVEDDIRITKFGRNDYEWRDRIYCRDITDDGIGFKKGRLLKIINTCDLKDRKFKGFSCNLDNCYFAYKNTLIKLIKPA